MEIDVDIAISYNFPVIYLYTIGKRNIDIGNIHLILEYTKQR